MKDSQMTFKQNGTRKFTPDVVGKYFFTFGTSKGKNFGGGNITATQDGITFPLKLTKAGKRALFLGAGKETQITLSGAKKPNLVVKISATK